MAWVQQSTNNNNNNNERKKIQQIIVKYRPRRLSESFIAPKTLEEMHIAR